MTCGSVSYTHLDVYKRQTGNDDEEPSEAELCECCGEKRRGTKADPDSPYCEECDLGDVYKRQVQMIVP